MRADLIGFAVAGWLRRAWSATPEPALPATDLCGAAARVLVVAGGDGLAWRGAAATGAELAEIGNELRREQGRVRLQAKVAEAQLARAADVLDRARVRWFLAKGWAVARLYPDPGDRPCGDFDAFVHPNDMAAATAALQRAVQDGPLWLDLHAGCPYLPDADYDAVWARAETVSVHQATVRVAGAADHLRLLAFHALKHGVWRPLWLTDLGAALGAGGIDPVVLAGRDRRLQRWLGCALGLARDLLGADTANLPPAIGQQVPPPWAVATVLCHWSRPHRSLPVVRWSDAAGLRRAWATFFNRIPDPIAAICATGGDFVGSVPRWRQGRALADKLARFTTERVRSFASSG